MRTVQPLDRKGFPTDEDNQNLPTKNDSLDTYEPPVPEETVKDVEIVVNTTRTGFKLATVLPPVTHSITYFHWLKICIQTKVLNTTVLSRSSPIEWLNIGFPAKFKTNVTTSWYILCPIIIFHIVALMRGADFGSGLRLRRWGVGGSVAITMLENKQ